MARKDIPASGSTTWPARVTEELRTLLGKLGSWRDTAATLGALVDAGILKVVTGANGSVVSISPGSGVYTGNTGGSAGGGGSGGGAAYEPDLTPPPTPTGFAVDSGFTSIFASCDEQFYTAGHGHARTNVYGVPVTAGAPLPTFSSAVLLYTFQGTVSSYAVNPGATYRLWIKWQTVDGVESTDPAGGINGLAVTTAQDPGFILDLLTGKLSRSMLDQSLRNTIGRIPDIDRISVTLLNTVLTEWENTQLAAQQLTIAREEVTQRMVLGQLSEARRSSLLAASLQTTDKNLRALVSEETVARTTKEGALTESIRIAQSTANDAVSGVQMTNAFIQGLERTQATKNQALAEDIRLQGVELDRVDGTASGTATAVDQLTTRVSDTEDGLEAETRDRLQLETDLTIYVDGKDGALGRRIDGNADAVRDLTTRVGETEDGLEAAARARTQLASDLTTYTDQETKAVGDRLDDRVDGVDGRIDGVDDQIEGLGDTVGGLAQTVSEQGVALAPLPNKVQATAAALDDLDTLVRNTDTGLVATANSLQQLEVDVSRTVNYRVHAGRSYAASGLFGQANQRLFAGGRGWNVVSFNSTTGAFDGTGSWDTYGDPSSADAMAAALTAYPIGKVLVFFTLDEPSANHSAAWRSAMLEWGATAVTLDTMQFGSCYILVGQRGIGEAGGIEKFSGPDLAIDYMLQVVNGLPVGLGGAKGALAAARESTRAAVAVEAGVRATETGYLGAQYTVRLDVAGLVSGFGISSNNAEGAGQTSAFGARANRFYIAPPAFASATDPSATQNMYDGFVWLDTSTARPIDNPPYPGTTRYRTGSTWSTQPTRFPFVVQTTPEIINGVEVPAGLYADNAFFARFVAKRGQIGSLAVDDASISDLSAVKLTAGSVKVGVNISSTGFVSGSTGWRITGDGSAEFQGVIVRGTVYATAGQIGGITIDGDGIRSSNFNAAGTGFRLRSNGDADIAGTIRASAGTIGGNVIGPTFIRSSSYAAGSSGWNLNSDGTGQIGGIYMGNGALSSTNWNGDRIGWAITADGNIFVNSGIFGGALRAASGTFSGQLTAAAINAVQTVNIAGNAVTVPYSGAIGGNGSFVYNHGASESINVAFIVRSRLGQDTGEGGTAETTLNVIVNGSSRDSISGIGWGTVMFNVVLPPGDNTITCLAVTQVNFLVIGCKR